MGTSREGVLTLTRPSFAKDIILASDGEPIQSIYEESLTQEYHLGTKLIYNDGRIFRYAKNGGTALSKALMTQGETIYAYSDDETQSTYGGSANVGDIEIDIDVTTGGSWTANEFAQGFLINSSGTATCIGDIYKIVANEINGSDDTLMRVQLETPIRVAWDTSSVIFLTKSPWRDVDVGTTTAVGTPTGIPLIDVTANYFFWAQTGGYAPCIVDDSETLVNGEPVGYPATVADDGAVGVPGATDAVWGFCVITKATDAAAMIDLKLDT
jgi:hypothetical protein